MMAERTEWIVEPKRLDFQVCGAVEIGPGFVLVIGLNCGDDIRAGDIFDHAYPCEVRKTDYSNGYHMRPGVLRRIYLVFESAQLYSSILDFLSPGGVARLRLKGHLVPPDLADGWILGNEATYREHLESMRAADEYLSCFNPPKSRKK